MVQLARVFAGTKGPIDQALGLRGSLLPHREDSIPELEPLLALVVNFGNLYIDSYTVCPAKVYISEA